MSHRRDDLVTRCDIIQEAVSLRSRGRYQEALHHLEISDDFVDNTSLQGERALTYVLQHRYNELLQLLPEHPPEEVHSESKAKSFNRMLRDFALFHGELMLREAVLSSKVIASRWLIKREDQEYDRLDVYMICLYAIIQFWGKKFFPNLESDKPETELPPPATMLCELRSRLLKSYRFEELLIAQILEAEISLPAVVIPKFQETLAHIRMYSAETGVMYEELEAHTRLLLHNACCLQGEPNELASTELKEIQEIFNRTGNANGVTWVELYLILPCGEPKFNETSSFEEILDKFERLHDYKGTQICSFAIAKIHRKKQEFETYASTLLSLLETRAEDNNRPFVYQPLTIPQVRQSPMIIKQPFEHGLRESRTKGDNRRRVIKKDAAHQDLKDLPFSSSTNRDQNPHQIRYTNFNTEQYDNDASNDMSQPQDMLPGHGSMFNFWQSYLDLLADDLRDNRRIGSAIAICSQFCGRHPECSISQFQYLFASTISECSGGFGDVPMALAWAKTATDFVEAADDGEMMGMANYHFQSTFASQAVTRKTDPTGMEQRELVRSKKEGLEIEYQEALASGDFTRQYGYAKELLDMQLSAEIKSATNPTGEPWLSRARQATERLSGYEKEMEGSWVDFAAAHAKFEFGDYDTAISLIDEITSKARDSELKSRAFFTKGRAHMQVYLNSNDETAWTSSHQALQTASEIAIHLRKPDCVACCHTMLAALWRVKVSEDPSAGPKTLGHIEEAEKIWSEELVDAGIFTGLSGVYTRYSLRHQGIGGPYDIYGNAFSVCFEISDFTAAWRWAQRAKARVFCDSLGSIQAPVYEAAIHQPPQSFLPGVESENGIVYVHWVTADEIIYMLTRRLGETPQMFPLGIDLPTVTQWYSDLLDAQDDLSDAESAEEILAELNSLVEPLGRDEVSMPGELLVLCPTKLLFKIPLHALFVGDEVLLSRNPVLYSHAISLHEPQRRYTTDPTGQQITQDHRVAIFSNPTGDIPGGVEALRELGRNLGGTVLMEKEATKEAYIQLCLTSRLVHYHGHVITKSGALANSMIFHKGVQLYAREVFSLDLHHISPLICLIGCGSGAHQLRPGDEPLGFIPAFLYAGASAVLATLWPIHDSLSGAAFTKVFYKEFMEETKGRRKPVDLALSLQKAALEIRSRDETRAPYFWAGFVLHCRWSFEL